MEAVYVDDFARNRVRIVAVLYGARVQIRFEGSGEVVVPISMLELEPLVRAELEQWRALPPGSLTENEYLVLERLSQAGDRGLLDREYPIDRKAVEAARRVLRHKGLVGPADARPAKEGDGRAVRWRLTKQGVIEYVLARRLARPIARGGGRQLATAVGSNA